MMRRFSELPLSAKGVMVVAIPVCALLVAMAVFLLFQQESREAQDWVDHTYLVRSEIRQATQELVEAQAAMRGYALTGEDRFLARYRDAQRDLPRHFSALRQLTDDNSHQVGKLNQLENESARLFQSLGSIDHDTARLEAAEVQMDRVRASLEEMLNEESRLLNMRRAQEREAQQRLEAAIFAGGALGLLGGIVAALIFAKRIAGRVRLLEEEARRVAEGLPMRLELEGNDEIARLGRTLKETSELIVAQTGELRAAREDLELRVAERTAELQTANEQLRSANEMREAIIGSCPLAIWAIDLEGTVTFWNPAAERIFGWTADETVGHALPVVSESGLEEYREWLERFRQGERLAGDARERRKKDGSRVEVLIWTAPLRDAEGHINGTIAIDSDVTQQRSLEEQFRQSQKLEAVGRLAGGVAHDFNNLLTVIMGYIEMLMAEAGDRSTLLDYAREVQYATSRASALTAQLLAFGRRQISQPRVLDLNEVVTHSLKLLERIIGEDIEISAHLDPALGKVKIDPIHVDQVMMNLLVNARDAMASGGRLMVETAEVTLDEHYADRHLGVAPGRYVMLAISDTGMGMSAETRSHIFEPFFTTKEVGKGTGLGLSIVYGIIKQAGGEIGVYSEEGKGTTFKIYLPLADVGAEISAAPADFSTLRGRETILLCEDEEHIRKLVETLLKRQGYTVLAASTPDRALEIARQQDGPINLLLTDVVMPRMSGFDLAREIQQVKPGVKLLFMSGYTDNRVSDTWMLEPDTPFIQKPFTMATLMQGVRGALRTPAAAG